LTNCHNQDGEMQPMTSGKEITSSALPNEGFRLSLNHKQIQLWLHLLQGFLIPIINTTFVEICTTAYLITLFSSSCPKTQRLDSRVQEWPKSHLLNCPLLIYRKTKLPRRVATLWPTPRMVVHRCSDTSTPGNQYSRVNKN
jgi:hypothetical protein